MAKKKKKTKREFFKIIIGLFTLIIVFLLVLGIVKANDTYELIQKNTILKMDDNKNQNIIINSDQIVRITSDGIRAYDFKGVEKWSDTLTLTNIKISQQEPYFAIGDRNGKKIDIYNQSGKKNSINTENPIVYFSINKNGDVAIVEDIKEGYVVSVYNENGTIEALKSTTYSKDLEFPIVAKISPDSKNLIISYIDLKKPIVSSNVVSISIEEPSHQSIYPIRYAILESDNLVYDIEFISNDKWISIGDNFIHWYLIDGTLINKVTGVNASFYPSSRSYLKSGNLVVVENSPSDNPEAFNKGVLKIYNSNGKLYHTQTFDEQINFASLSPSEIVLKSGEIYYGVNYNGNIVFKSKNLSDYKDIVFSKGFNHIIGIKDLEIVEMQKDYFKRVGY